MTCKRGFTASDQRWRIHSLQLYIWLMYLITQMNWITNHQTCYTVNVKWLMLDTQEKINYLYKDSIGILNHTRRLGGKPELWFGISIDGRRDEFQMKFIFKCHFHLSFLSIHTQTLSYEGKTDFSYTIPPCQENKWKSLSILVSLTYEVLFISSLLIIHGLFWGCRGLIYQWRSEVLQQVIEESFCTEKSLTLTRQIWFK